MRLSLCAALLVLSGCNPVAYVPPLIPAAPTSPGVHVSAGLAPLTSQGTVSVEVAPVEGIGLYARGLYAHVLRSEDEGDGLISRGAEVGVLGSVPLSDQAALDMGLFAGRDAIRTSAYGFDTGCCSGRRSALDLTTQRGGGHVGVFVGRADSRGVSRRIGPTVRMVRTTVFREDEESGVGVFVEPALRFRVSSSRVDLLFQVGASFEVGDGFDDYLHVPITAGATASVPLNRLW